MSMKSKVAAKTNESISLAVVVSSKGMGKKMMMTAGVAGVAGMAGQAIASATMNKKAPTSPGEHSGYIVMALGPSKLSFFKMKRGLLSNSPGDLLVEVPRESVTNYAIGGGALTSELTIELNDGTVWALEVPKVGKGKAEKLRKELLGA